MAQEFLGDGTGRPPRRDLEFIRNSGFITGKHHLLALPELYRVVPARAEWTALAHANLRRERALLL